MSSKEVEEFQLSRVSKALTSIASEYLVFASNEQETHTVMHLLSEKDIAFKVLLGSYKGTLETSFLIHKSYFKDIKELVKNEESILSLSNLQKGGVREGSLIFIKTGQTTSLGIFEEITKEEANDLEAWSFDCKDNKYYGVK